MRLDQDGPHGQVVRTGLRLAPPPAACRRSAGSAAASESVKLLWQHLAAQPLEVALHRRCLLAFALSRRLFVKLARPEFGQQPVLLDRAFEAAHRDFKRLVFFYADDRHFAITELCKGS